MGTREYVGTATEESAATVGLIIGHYHSELSESTRAALSRIIGEASALARAFGEEDLPEDLDELDDYAAELHDGSTRVGTTDYYDSTIFGDLYSYDVRVRVPDALVSEVATLLGVTLISETD